MCGPCSDGTYWDGKNKNAYGCKWTDPSEERCEECDSPVNWCHCELSLGRIITYDSKGKAIVKKRSK